MTLAIGETVTRKELAEIVRAGGDSCFLHKSCVVVAIAVDPVKNPDAPERLLVGKGPHKERYAEAFMKTGAYVPTFIKRGADKWEYAGEFRGKNLVRSPAFINAHAARSGRTDIWGVLNLVSA